MTKLSIIIAILVALAATAWAGSCHTHCYNIGNQQFCDTSCY